MLPDSNIDTSEQLIAKYKELINITLPGTYTFPVRYNHCFGRIILDWLFQDCWYNHLFKNKPAIHQLNQQQIQSAINRMNRWLENQQLLIFDNNASLGYRKKNQS
jgi:hypothetical protein